MDFRASGFDQAHILASSVGSDTVREGFKAENSASNYRIYFSCVRPRHIWSGISCLESQIPVSFCIVKWFLLISYLSSWNFYRSTWSIRYLLNLEYPCSTASHGHRTRTVVIDAKKILITTYIVILHNLYGRCRCLHCVIGMLPNIVDRHFTLHCTSYTTD